MGHYEIKDSVSEPLPRLDWCSPLPRRHAPNPQDGSPRATSSIVPRQEQAPVLSDRCHRHHRLR